eukprot:CAMPEP_0177711822 /NCGR_PEP_ID=MMETSP0484_2-20121128/12064_1 /TAXON_ID=354590 /ORGANISM="Rhodomonas lens, Strain RHODO" /LENGTH=68 /DNA_ID=CAMNT_0019223577 /DNA_START=14 /DNA_END=215 /DNA_ORIENTATION=-
MAMGMPSLSSSSGEPGSCGGVGCDAGGGVLRTARAGGASATTPQAGPRSPSPTAAAALAALALGVRGP